MDKNEELRIMKLTLELAKESDDELWKELVMLHLDDMRMGLRTKSWTLKFVVSRPFCPQK